MEHTPATEPISLAILEGKAAQYRQVRRLRQSDLGRSSLTIGKDGQWLPEPATTAAQEQQGADQSLVEVTAANRQVYYQGYHVSLPTTFAGRQFYRTITDDEFLLLAPESGEVVFPFPLPMIALQVRGDTWLFTPSKARRYRIRANTGNENSQSSKNTLHNGRNNSPQSSTACRASFGDAGA